MLHSHNGETGSKKSKFILLFLVNFLLTFFGQYSFTMPALSNKQKTKCNNMATAHQPCHKSQAGSPLLIPDSGNIGSSAPESDLEFITWIIEILVVVWIWRLKRGMSKIIWERKRIWMTFIVMMSWRSWMMMNYWDYCWRRVWKREQQSKQPLTAYKSLLQPSSAEQWKKAEQRRGMGYSGPLAERTVREHKQKAWEAEMIAQEIQKG